MNMLRENMRLIAECSQKLVRLGENLWGKGSAEEEVSFDTESEWLKHEILLPNGYIFKDENGNVINSQKIIMEKKKKEYPKTYKECCDVLGLNTMDNDAQGYKWELIIRFQELLIARDAYWKIAGEDMGLGKSWEPDWNGKLYYLYYNPTNTTGVVRGFTSDGVLAYVVLAFPTKEMRDAFYENFRELIESCKELL